MSTFKQILRKLRTEQNLTQKELADKLGISKSAVSMYELGNREPDFETEEAFARFFDVSIEYLRFGTTSKNPIPLLGSIACGIPILAEQNYKEYVSPPEGVRADFALRCEGDSMINARIFSGDIVYLKAQTDVDDGQIAAVIIDDEATLKRVRKYEGKVVLQAENPLYSNIVIEDDLLEKAHIIGRAVAFLSDVI